MYRIVAKYWDGSVIQKDFTAQHMAISYALKLMLEHCNEKYHEYKLEVSIESF